MIAAETPGSSHGVCPYLGLDRDARSRYAFSDPTHRCYAGARPVAVGVQRQAAACLGAAYPECEQFARAAAAGSMGAGRDAAAGIPATGRRRTLAASPRTIGAVTVLASIGAIVAVGGGWPGGASSNLLVASTAAPTGSPTVRPTVAPTARSTVAPSAPSAPPSTPTPSSGPASSPLPTSTPLPTQLVHTVASGETLTSIAAHYKVTVAAIVTANHLAHPSLIVTGDRLIIPPAP